MNGEHLAVNAVNFFSIMYLYAVNHFMSRVAHCIDNGAMDGFWGILKCEMYYLQRFQSYEELAAAIENFIYFYNHWCRQRKLERLAPADYRSLFQTAA